MFEGANKDREDEEEGESDSALTDNPLLILIFDDIIYINSINAPCTITNLRWVLEEKLLSAGHPHR